MAFGYERALLIILVQQSPIQNASPTEQRQQQRQVSAIDSAVLFVHDHLHKTLADKFYFKG